MKKVYLTDVCTFVLGQVVLHLFLLMENFRKINFSHQNYSVERKIALSPKCHQIKFLRYI